MRVVPDRRSRARSCTALFTTVFMSRSVRSAGTWRAKLKEIANQRFCTARLGRGSLMRWRELYPEPSDRRRADRKNRGDRCERAVVDFVRRAWQLAGPEKQVFPIAQFVPAAVSDSRWIVPIGRAAASGPGQPSGCARKSRTRSGTEAIRVAISRKSRTAGSSWLNRSV